MEGSNYNIKFAPIASEDLDHIYAYISQQTFTDQVAKELLKKMEFHIMRLRDFPLSGNSVEDAFLRSKGYRKLIVGNYIIFYLVNESEKQVVIMRVLYGAQNYQDFL